MGRKTTNVCYRYIKAPTIYGALIAMCTWHALSDLISTTRGGEPIFPSSEPVPEVQRKGLALSHMA